MTLAAKPRSCLLLFPLSPRMATDTLTVESLSKVDPGLLIMTCGTTNVWIPLLEFAFIQYVLSITVDVMAIHAGEVSGHVNVVRERDLGTLLLSVCLLVVDYDLLRLRPECGTHRSHQNGHQKQTHVSLIHALFPSRPHTLCATAPR